MIIMLITTTIIKKVDVVKKKINSILFNIHMNINIITCNILTSMNITIVMVIIMIMTIITTITRINIIKKIVIIITSIKKEDAVEDKEKVKCNKVKVVADAVIVVDITIIMITITRISPLQINIIHKVEICQIKQ